MPGRKKESFNVTEKDSINNKDREIGLAQGKEKVMATKKERGF
jgi:hypothetical protein